MPNLQAMAERMNFALNRNNIAALDPADFEPGASLVDTALKLGIATTEAEVNFLQDLPETFKETIRATIQTALAHEGYQMPVQIIWMPGYDYELTMTESAGTESSIGGVSIVVRSRYPADRIRGIHR